MPRTCCVPGCSANYKSEKSPVVTTFRFPKDMDLREKWIKAIRRKDFIPNHNSAVCVRHFSDDLVVRIDTATRDDGSVLSVPRLIPKLVSHAVPHIFPNQPSYFTTKPVLKRKSPVERQKEQMARLEASFARQTELDSIKDFSSFKTSVAEKNENKFEFHHFIQTDAVMFFKLQFSVHPQVTTSFKVLPDLSVEIWHDSVSIPTVQFQSVLGKDLKLNKWSKFHSLLSQLSSFSLEKSSVDDKLKMCSLLIAQCAQELSEDESKSSALKFLAEQIENLTLKHPKYSTETLAPSCFLFFSNASAYCLLRSLGILCLPSPSYLRQLSRGLEVGTGNQSSIGSIRQQLKTMLSSIRQQSDQS